MGGIFLTSLPSPILAQKKTDSTDVWRFWSGELYEKDLASATNIDCTIVRAYRDWIDLSQPDTVEVPLAIEYNIDRSSVELVVNDAMEILKAWFTSSGGEVIECDYTLYSMLMLKASPVRMQLRKYIASSKKDTVTVETQIAPSLKRVEKYIGRDADGYLNGIPQKHQTTSANLTAADQGKVIGSINYAKDFRIKIETLIQCLFENNLLEKDGIIYEQFKNEKYDWDFSKFTKWDQCQELIEKIFSRTDEEILASKWKVPKCDVKEEQEKVRQLHEKFELLLQCLLDNKTIETDGIIIEMIKNEKQEWDFRKCKNFEECTVILDKMFGRLASEILASNWKLPDCKKPGGQGGGGKPPQGGNSNGKGNNK